MKLVRQEVEEGDWGDAGPAEAVQLSLKERAVRGGLVIAFTQAAKFLFRLGATMVLARLLSPADFGLVGMVTVVTGFLALFREAGLSLATVQQDVITREQISTLFWINMLVGVTLAGLAVVMAPALVAFYREPRLFWISIWLASGFIFSASAAQPQALLQRKLRFLTLAFIDVISILASIIVGIGMAVKGYGLWALVGMAVTAPLVAAAGSWVAAAWLPGLPVRGCGVGSMVQFGGVFTLNTVITYLAFNAEKMLLGRYAGAEALGLYGRAYQLVTLPTDQLYSSMGTVAFSALPRLQNEPDRLARYFLKGYSLFLSMTIPITIVSVLYAHEMILVALGPKWLDAVPVFQLLAPTVIVFGLINPFSWLLVATGQAMRNLKIACVIAPLVLVAYMIGVRFGPIGVAVSYSAIMIVLALPVIVWSTSGTAVRLSDIANAARPPFQAGVIAGLVGLSVNLAAGPWFQPLTRLALGGCLVFGLYAWILLFRLNQKEFHVDLLRQVFRPATQK